MLIVISKLETVNQHTNDPTYLKRMALWVLTSHHMSM
jgi:hypothetical protein